MLKPLIPLMLTASLLSACDSTSLSASSGQRASASASSSSGLGTQEVTLSGDTGQAKLAGDQLKLREGKLYINEQVVADTPPGAVIRYVAAGSIKSLYINGKSAATKP